MASHLPPSRVILVTGANRGIGFAIIQALATHTPTDRFIVGCRDLAKGEAAVQSLREKLSVTNTSATIITPLQLDVTSDASLRAAVEHLEAHFDGQLDVLVNNAGLGLIPSAEDFSDYRSAYAATMDTNVTSIAMSMSLFLPLLRKSSSNPIIINVSSGRGSLSLSASGKMPPTVSVPYTISKTALNGLTLEYSRTKGNEGVQFQCASPGHCRTAFNGFRGLRDPLEGANVVVELANAEKGKYPTACWQTEGTSRELVQIPW